MTMTTRTKHIAAPPSTIVEEVRQGRNFVRKGDPVRVRLAGKKQFRSGFKFVGWDTKREYALVKDLDTGNLRSVTLDGIKRMAVTKSGERKV